GAAGRGSVAEILEAQGDRKILSSDGGDDGLQLVFALAGHSDFFALNLGGDLELAVADKAGNFFGNGGFDALLDFDDLPRVAEWGNVGLAFIDVFEADGAFGEFADDDFDERLELELIFGGDLDFIFLEHDLRGAALEIEAIGQLFLGLVDRVLDFHRVDLRNNVE